MRKGHSITGLQVLSQDSGKDLGKVLDLIFDHDANQCLALVLREKSLLHSAQVVRYQNVIGIGKDAVIISSEESVINPLDDSRLRVVLERDTYLSGTRIVSENGQELGTFADVYLDEESGSVVGYEVSGGFVSDTISGKRYIPAERTAQLRVGDDVLIAPNSLLYEFANQASQEPGGLKGTFNSATEKVSETYDAAKDKVTHTYSNVAEASVEKQKELVVGKTAGKDVYLPAPTMTAADVIVEDHAPLIALDEAAHEMDHGPILVHQGEVITRVHADHAEDAGILHQLLLAAGAHTTGNLVDSAKGKLSPAQIEVGEQIHETKQSREERAIGQRAGKEVNAMNGSTIVAPGMIITREIMETARINGKESEVIASAGVGTLSTGAQSASMNAGDKLTSVWETIKDKTAELTGAASEKKGEYDAANEQKRINNALGRPVTRVILAKDDTVILNTGEIITHKAVELSRQNDMLDVLLESAHMEEPELSPESLRVAQPGEAALVEQTK
jgi:uncharacterized protein YrrD